MAIKTRNKVSANFSMSSMTDLVFLLLIFFMITSTMVNPNALKLLLPQSTNQTVAKPHATVSITKDLQFFVGSTPVAFEEIAPQLIEKMSQLPEDQQYISLHVDKSVPMEQVVKVMNIAKDNHFKLILATAAEDKK